MADKSAEKRGGGSDSRDSLGEWRPSEAILAALSPDAGKLITDADKALRDLDDAVLGGDSNGVRSALAKYDAIAWRLNGDTLMGSSAEGGGRHRLAAELSDTPGSVPRWGRDGEFLVVEQGMRVWVRASALGNAGASVHFELLAVDTDRPFISETGYRSIFYNLKAPAGSVEEEARALISALIHEKRPRHITNGDCASVAIPHWLASISPLPSRRRPPVLDVAGDKSRTESAISITNAAIEADLPADRFEHELTPGGMKAVKSAARRADAYIYLPLEQLVVLEDLNPRVESPTYAAKVRMYADDMKLNGFRIDKPISCYIERNDAGDRIIVTDGHTRRRAAMLAISEGADFSEVPVALLPKSTSMDDVLVGLVTANNGSPLTMLETSIIVKRLLNRNMSVPEIAESLHVTATHIDTLATLAGAPRALQMMVAADQVAGTTVVDLITAIGAERALKQLTDQLQRAQSKGQTRVTAKHLPAMKFEKAVKRQAPQMYQTLAVVRSDPGYAALSVETRARLEAQTEELDALREAAEA